MKIKTENFNLKHTLECGQLFRYEKKDGFYFLNAGERIIKLKQEKNTLYFEGASRSFVENYLALDEDYERMLKNLKKDRKLHKAIKNYSGMRIARQDPWECLISYICSAASNIPKIKRNVDNLAKSFGKRVKIGDYASYSFPEKKGISDFCTIEKCGCGFRSRYIFETSKKADEKWLDSLAKLGYDDAKKELMKLPGVGEKIADCVLLFSLGFGEAFPVDVWIKRVMEKLYFDSKKTSEKRIREFARKKWGKYAGYAQQFLYHSARNG